MIRPCDVCSTPYEAKRKTSRYCSSSCRVRASRLGGVDPATVVVDLMAASDAGPVEAATLATLSEVDKVAHPLGAAALVLARRLDNPGVDTGSAVASLVARLEATLTTVTRGHSQTSAQSYQDELAARRAKHA